MNHEKFIFKLIASNEITSECFLYWKLYSVWFIFLKDNDNTRQASINNFLVKAL